MPKAHIKLPNGTSIVIDGAPDEVVAIVNQIQGRDSSRTASARSTAQKAKREEKKQATAKDHVTMLKEESFFDKPKSLSEVAKKLEESGHLYPTTTLSGVMLGLVQKRILSRIKRDGVWMYGKR